VSYARHVLEDIRGQVEHNFEEAGGGDEDMFEGVEIVG